MGYEEETTVNLGLPYYDSLLPEEQQEVTEAVKLLLRQTFVLGTEIREAFRRFTNNPGVSDLQQASGISAEVFCRQRRVGGENSQMGVIYIQGRPWWATSFRSLPLFYLLILKLIYDEQMATVSHQRQYLHVAGRCMRSWEITGCSKAAVAHRHQKGGHPAEKNTRWWSRWTCWKI